MRPVSGVGQVYADVLTVKHLEQICDRLNIRPGSRHKVNQDYHRSDGSVLTLSYFDILRWLDLPSQTVGTKRTLVETMRKVHTRLFAIKNTPDGHLTNADESLYRELGVFMEVDIDGPLLPLPRYTTCPPLTHEQFCAVKTKRAPFDARVHDFQAREEA